MNQYKKTALLWGLLLAILGALLSGCINALPEDFYTTSLETTLPSPEETNQTTPEETTPEPTTPTETTTEEPTTEKPPELTTPEETTTEQPQIPPEPVKKIKIYIDQGHNPFLPKQNPDDPNKGWNTGASNEELGLYEQDLTYEIGILLAELLAKDDRFEIRLSRPTADTILGTDNDSALDFRINDAAEWGADYFISLHTNSYKNDLSVRGVEVYTANGDEEGYALGNNILNELVESTSLRNRGMRDGSELRVLKNAQMPAALVEMAYLSNADDAKLLDESPELFVQGIYNGILSYFEDFEATPVDTVTTVTEE